MKAVFILIWTVLTPAHQSRSIYYDGWGIQDYGKPEMAEVTKYEEFKSSQTLLARIAELPESAKFKVYEGKEREIVSSKIYSFNEVYEIFTFSTVFSSASIIMFSTVTFGGGNEYEDRIKKLEE